MSYFTAGGTSDLAVIMPLICLVTMIFLVCGALPKKFKVLTVLLCPVVCVLFYMIMIDAQENHNYVIFNLSTYITFAFYCFMFWINYRL